MPTQLHKLDGHNIDFDEIFNLTGDAYCIGDRDLKIIAFNESYAKLMKLDPPQLLGANTFSFYPQFEKSVFFECLRHTLATGQPNIAIGYSNNTEKHLISRTFAYKEYIVLVVQEFKSVLQKSSFSNTKDHLTSLYSKDTLDYDLNELLKNQIAFSLILLDINNFKALNNEFGIEIGDLVLMETAARLKKSVQEKIYRLHGNLFAITVLGNKEQGLRQTGELLKIIKTPLSINSKEYTITASAGINYVKTFDDNSAIVLNHAETALKKAKTVKGSYFEHSHTYAVAKKNEMSLLKEIDTALKSKQLVPYYQGQVDVLSKKLMGAEALVRWNHPSKGVIPPSEFLALIKKMAETEI